MAGLGALRSGAGLVTVATPRSCLAAVASSQPEYMTLPLPETAEGTLTSEALGAVLDFPCDVIAAGPGLGLNTEVAGFVYGLVGQAEVPLVLDDDALNVLSDEPNRLNDRRVETVILTPHPGEMSRLNGGTSAKVQFDRIGGARSFAEDHKVHVVLKGASTVIASPDGCSWLNLTGNPGMATGGVGDVLTGATAAWLGQLGHADAACQIAVFLHGRAGDLVAGSVGEVGLTATDLAGALGQASCDLVDSVGESEMSEI